MTIKEAIVVLKKNHCYDKCDDCMWFEDADGCEIAVAIEALEKQIPQKVERNKCPVCGKDVVGSGFYCWNCGQKLDWGE